MMATLSGRHALVTGGGRGIGRAVAEALSAAGASVTVLGRGREVLDEAVAAGHAKGVIVADVTDPAAIAAGIKEAVSARGPFDILVANAGGVATAPFAKTGRRSVPAHVRSERHGHHPLRAGGDGRHGLP